MSPSLSTLALRVLKILAGAAAITAGGAVLLLLLCQDSLIYHPRRYPAGVEQTVPAMVPLTYRTGQGAQEAFYLPPRVPPLGDLWVVFSGNGSLVLHAAPFLRELPLDHAGSCS